MTDQERSVVLTSNIIRFDEQLVDMIGAYLEHGFTPGPTEVGVGTGHIGFSVLGDEVTELIPQLEPIIAS